MRPRQQNKEGGEVSLPSQGNSLTAALYKYYAPKLFTYLCQHIPTIDDAEDILLEVFLVVLEHQLDLETMLEDEQRAWLWTVARNKGIDYHRRTRRHQIVPLDHIAEVVDDAWTPEQVALRHEEHDDLGTSLKRLSVTQQEVLQLRFSAGLRCTEIAKVLGKREGTIRTMLSRALDTLRNIYEQ